MSFLTIQAPEDWSKASLHPFLENPTQYKSVCFNLCLYLQNNIKTEDNLLDENEFVK